MSNSYTIVPSYRGKYPIPSISFSYFNPDTGTYKTLNSEEILINVLEGPTDTSFSNPNATNTSKQDVIQTGGQFNFIKTKPNLIPIGTDYFFNSVSFYLWWLLPYY